MARENIISVRFISRAPYRKSLHMFTNKHAYIYTANAQLDMSLSQIVTIFFHFWTDFTKFCCSSCTWGIFRCCIEFYRFKMWTHHEPCPKRSQIEPVYPLLHKLSKYLQLVTIVVLFMGCSRISLMRFRCLSFKRQLTMQRYQNAQLNTFFWLLITQFL